MNELFGGDDGCDTGGTLPVGSKPDAASPYGALDMAGNAEEWVADFYAPDYYGESPSSDPTGPSDGAGRSVRGGSFHSIAQYLRTSRRRGSVPEHADSGRGFRCARSL